MVGLLCKRGGAIRGVFQSSANLLQPPCSAAFCCVDLPPIVPEQLFRHRLALLKLSKEGCRGKLLSRPLHTFSRSFLAVNESSCRGDRLATAISNATFPGLRLEAVPLGGLMERHRSIQRKAVGEAAIHVNSRQQGATKAARGLLRDAPSSLDQPSENLHGTLDKSGECTHPERANIRDSEVLNGSPLESSAAALESGSQRQKSSRLSTLNAAILRRAIELKVVVAQSSPLARTQDSKKALAEQRSRKKKEGFLEIADGKTSRIESEVTPVTIAESLQILEHGSFERLRIVDEDVFKEHLLTVKDSEHKQRISTYRTLAGRILSTAVAAPLPNQNIKPLVQCGTCWLPIENCMCGEISALSRPLWPGMKIWMLMHSKEFLRKNNTGKVMWQLFGEESVRLSISGLDMHEDEMWKEFESAGRHRVFLMYPERKAQEKMEIFYIDTLPLPPTVATPEASPDGASQQEPLHFVFLDGTWNNSTAMLVRLQQQAERVWGQKMACLCLTPGEPSKMHSLRPQPALEKVCTAAAASTLLRELGTRDELQEKRLGEAADTTDYAIEVLIKCLQGWRARAGQSPTRSPTRTPSENWVRRERGSRSSSPVSETREGKANR